MMKKKYGAVISDPLRFAMEYRLCKKGVLALFALLMAANFALTMKLCAAMEGAAVIAACGTLGAAMLTAFAWRAAKEEKPNVMVLLCLAALSMLAVAAHLGMLDIKPGRYGKVLEPMLSDMWNYGLVTAMAWEDGAWSGLYLVICGLLSRVENFSWLYALKLIDMLCQCASAGAVLCLARLGGAKTWGAIAAMLGCVLAPTMLMNAGVWVQCDALFAMLTLWGLVQLLRDRPAAGCALWGLALAAKLQSAFLFPLLIVLFMKNRLQLRHLLVLAAAAFLSQMAILLDGQDFYSLVSRYAVQLDNARWGSVGLSDNMPGVYKLMNVASVREFSGMGMYFGAACALMVVCALLRAKKALSSDTLLLSALLLACGLPLVLPQMNARCLYLAGMLAFACARNGRRMLVCGMLELISLCAYMASIFNTTVIPMPVLSLMAIGTASLVLYELLKELGAIKSGEELSA